MKLIGYIVPIFINAFCLNGQMQSKRTIQPPATKQFIPMGYEMLDEADGDINTDGLKDKILILKHKNEEKSAEKHRPVLLLIRQKNGSFKLAASNKNIVLFADMGGAMGDPYSGITIKGDYFSIEHLGGGGDLRWSEVITFKYDRKLKNWYLHKYGSEGWDNLQPEHLKFSKHKTVADFGKVFFAQYKNKSLEKD